MNSTIYRCPRCEQPFVFTDPLISDGAGGVTRLLHVCRRCGQYLCNPEAALDKPLQPETLSRRLTMVSP
ncbi:MAG: hypothetical protein P3T54_07535 [Dehalogenimonas sp.]|uniref:Zinc finger/thioredoxin putative domain-containing protein n=1 Tax=Candidatus Dehalogenimonas loeffleri TaxID=3127115 RepID=A0ABZ2J3M5_9CHLR|nr:hypothetical protein [Dehalogenimonas sp.]